MSAGTPLQNHAPPQDGEPIIARHEYDGPIPRPFDVWTGHGWCSACLQHGVRLVRFGTAERCVGLCADCIHRFATEIAEPYATETP
ncbi:MAG: hypothetical protein KF782_15450 [Labilithrix sp.]|nr:hypothetical protein [Labilithrix sp.]